MPLFFSICLFTPRKLLFLWLFFFSLFFSLTSRWCCAHQTPFSSGFSVFLPANFSLAYFSKTFVHLSVCVFLFSFSSYSAFSLPAWFSLCFVCVCVRVLSVCVVFSYVIFTAHLTSLDSWSGCSVFLRGFALVAHLARFPAWHFPFPWPSRPSFCLVSASPLALCPSIVSPFLLFGLEHLCLSVALDFLCPSYLDSAVFIQ